ncbi:MAG: response regulator [Flavisolibacter sp.]
MGRKSETYIVYVDDDPDDRELMADVFAAISDYHFITFEGGTAFLNYLDELSQSLLPCLVILDINMPELKGTDILVNMKSSEPYKDIPVVMFSTAANPQDKSFCKQYNTDVVPKPTKFEDVVDIARTLMAYCRK